MSLDMHLEGVLFYSAEPIKKETLRNFFEVDELILEEAIEALKRSLATRALTLVETDTTIELVVRQELSETIERMRKEELKKDIGKAGAETLAIVLYRGPLTRVEIDRIRGVNSSFILRNLMVRGLIEKRENPHNNKTPLFAITTELLNELGVNGSSSLPDYVSVMDALDLFEKSQKKDESEAVTIDTHNHTQ